MQTNTATIDEENLPLAQYRKTPVKKINTAKPTKTPTERMPDWNSNSNLNGKQSQNRVQRLTKIAQRPGWDVRSVYVTRKSLGKMINQEPVLIDPVISAKNGRAFLFSAANLKRYDKATENGKKFFLTLTKPELRALFRSIGGGFFSDLWSGVKDAAGKVWNEGIKPVVSTIARSGLSNILTRGAKLGDAFIPGLGSSVAKPAGEISDAALRKLGLGIKKPKKPKKTKKTKKGGSFKVMY